MLTFFNELGLPKPHSTAFMAVLQFLSEKTSKLKIVETESFLYLKPLRCWLPHTYRTKFILQNGVYKAPVSSPSLVSCSFPPSHVMF